MDDQRMIRGRLPQDWDAELMFTRRSQRRVAVLQLEPAAKRTIGLACLSVDSALPRRPGICSRAGVYPKAVTHR